MKGHILNKQRTIWAIGYVFWTMQFTRDVPKNDEQHFLRTTLQRSTSKLYRQFCHTCEDHRRTGRKNNLIFEDSRETQSVFQTIKMWL